MWPSSICGHGVWGTAPALIDMGSGVGREGLARRGAGVEGARLQRQRGHGGATVPPYPPPPAPRPRPPAPHLHGVPRLGIPQPSGLVTRRGQDAGASGIEADLGAGVAGPGARKGSQARLCLCRWVDSTQVATCDGAWGVFVQWGVREW